MSESLYEYAERMRAKFPPEYAAKILSRIKPGFTFERSTGKLRAINPKNPAEEDSP